MRFRFHTVATVEASEGGVTLGYCVSPFPLWSTWGAHR